MERGTEDFRYVKQVEEMSRKWKNSLCDVALVLFAGIFSELGVKHQIKIGFRALLSAKLSIVIYQDSPQEHREVNMWTESV